MPRAEAAAGLLAVAVTTWLSVAAATNIIPHLNQFLWLNHTGAQHNSATPSYATVTMKRLRQVSHSS